MGIISAGVVHNASTPKQAAKVGRAGTIWGSRDFFYAAAVSFLVEIN